MSKWKFPYGVDLTPSGHNNTAIEMFLDNIIDSLTREIIQNSLDAHDSSRTNEPVKVAFDFSYISANDIPGLQQIKDALNLAKEMWAEKSNKDTLTYLAHFEEVINQRKIPILKISDYNTKGLNESSYDSLVVGNAYSEKSSESSAGSKGIGKAAPFAASNLRMVFYNTVPTEGIEKSAGVMNFVSYYKNKNNNEITQERASFVESGKTYMNRQFTFHFPEREQDEFGTDIFIIGIKQLNKWERKILLSTINNFLVSIYKNELEIVVEGKKLNKYTLDSVITDLTESNMVGEERNKFDKTLRYYDVLTNEKTLRFHLDKRFYEFDFIESLEDGELHLLHHDPANRTVLQTREAGMKIYERNRISGNINFTGIFQAKGKKFNAFLKDMENANHNKWSVDRLQGDIKTQGEKLLKDLLQWYKQKVKENFGVASEKEIDAFGISDLLPVKREYDAEDNPLDSGVRNKVRGISIDNGAMVTPQRDGDAEDGELDQIIREVVNGPGQESGDGSRRQGKGNGDNPKGKYGPGNQPGEYGGEGERIIGETTRVIGPSKQVKLKFIERNANNGEYSIVCIPTIKLEKVRIELKYVGADGKSYKVKLIKVNSAEVEGYLKNNSVELNVMNRNKRFKVDIQIESSIRSKMEAIIYEVTG